MFFKERRHPCECFLFSASPHVPVARHTPCLSALLQSPVFQDFKRLLASHTPQAQPHSSALDRLKCAPAGPQYSSPLLANPQYGNTVLGSVQQQREVNRWCSSKTPWRFSIIQEEPERGRSLEELGPKLGPTEL